MGLGSTLASSDGPWVGNVGTQLAAVTEQVLTVLGTGCGLASWAGCCTVWVRVPLSCGWHCSCVCPVSSPAGHPRPWEKGPAHQLLPVPGAPLPAISSEHFLSLLQGFRAMKVDSTQPYQHRRSQVHTGSCSLCWSGSHSSLWTQLLFWSHLLASSPEAWAQHSQTGCRPSPCHNTAFSLSCGLQTLEYTPPPPSNPLARGSPWALALGRVGCHLCHLLPVPAGGRTITLCLCVPRKAVLAVVPEAPAVGIDQAQARHLAGLCWINDCLQTGQ